MLSEVVYLIKEGELGFLSDIPKPFIYLWLWWHLYWQKDYVLMTKEYYSLIGFILYNTTNKEIVVICVDELLRGDGFGTELIKKCPKGTIVVHRKKHRSYNFFMKNGFKVLIDLNDRQVLSRR